MANITFKSAELANKAVTRFNGAPIDNGKSRLRLNLIVDPNTVNQNLAQRLTGLQGRVGRPFERPTGRQSGRQPDRPSGRPSGRQSDRPTGRQSRPIPNKQPVRGPNQKAVLAKKSRQPRKEKPAKKSLEDLDKEMADYFDDGK